MWLGAVATADGDGSPAGIVSARSDSSPRDELTATAGLAGAGFASSLAVVTGAAGGTGRSRSRSPSRPVDKIGGSGAASPSSGGRASGSKTLAADGSGLIFGLASAGFAGSGSDGLATRDGLGAAGAIGWASGTTARRSSGAARPRNLVPERGFHRPCPS
jgi:hypothetical protein